MRTTVLVIDDDDMMRSSIVEMLDVVGFHVLPARNADEAFDIMRQKGSEVCLAISDLVMPEVGGVELCKRLRMLNPELPIVLVSGHDFDTRRDFGDTVLRPHFLQKPFSLKTLVQTVESAIGGSSPSEYQSRKRSAG